MALLLDTQAFLWWVEDSPRLSKKARAAIGRPQEACFVSLASCWEMAIKISLGHLHLAQRLDRFVAEHIAANGFHPLGVQLPHAARVVDLPFHHRDPFDRLLAAQALEEELSIVSADRVFARYGVKRVW
ncbi:MAG: type II toxin-antitoxin system VapC family toxin [Bryobacteraceae bacterium]